MKIKLLVLLISLATIFISLFNGRNAVLSLNLEAEKLHQFSELLPKYMVLPFMYDIRINMLGEKDALLFREYSEVLEPYLWLSLIALIILIVTFTLVLISSIKTFKSFLNHIELKKGKLRYKI
ncbi:hypothetical protein KQ41_06760 [Lysinibacillus fusiformis]|uniref:hypothetical protein n=1 Tax=Lysinibacillus fusiformis TaxID=28031 RepID=UPI0005010A18|nr:hypothetical protein [Lysinibacillus fusiformis]KGA83733.1 hypothetical protein KQ41_06760 [Lysinibacillus fusiformis]